MSRCDQLGGGFLVTPLDVVTTKERKSPEKDPSQVPFPTTRLAISLGDEASQGFFVSRRIQICQREQKRWGA